jgi:hypothetical protein
MPISQEYAHHLLDHTMVALMYSYNKYPNTSYMLPDMQIAVKSPIASRTPHVAKSKRNPRWREAEAEKMRLEGQDVAPQRVTEYHRRDRRDPIEVFIDPSMCLRYDGRMSWYTVSSSRLNVAANDIQI